MDMLFSQKMLKKPFKVEVFVNGKETSFDNVNVALRGLHLNKGNNIIECYFSPDVIKKSSYLSLD